MTTTVVTCYYKISNKRSHSDYSQWIQYFFSMPCNMYVFTDNYTMEILKKIAPSSSTNIHFHILELDNFYVSKYKELWENSLRIDIERRDFAVNHTVELYKIWAEKIFMIKRAIENNVFNSESFCWADIGSIRKPDMFPAALGFPKGLQKNLDPGKVMLSAVLPFHAEDFKLNNEGISYHFQNTDRDTSCPERNRIQGGFFAGYIKPLLEYADMYDKELELFQKTGTFGGKDQYVMANIFVKNPDKFTINPAFTRQYYYDEWFDYLIRFSS